MELPLKQRLRDPALIASFTNLPINARLASSDGELFQVITRHAPYNTGRGAVRPWMYTIIPAKPEGGIARQKTVYDLIEQGFHAV